MITTQGKGAILRSISGGGTPIAAIAVGVGQTAEALTDTALVYEIHRAPVVIASVDQTAGEVIYKAIIPEEVSGTVYELGAWSDYNLSDDAEPLLLTFEPESELWSVGTYVNTNSRIGEYGLQVTGTSTLYGLGMDLSVVLPTDVLSMAFYVNAGVTKVELRLGNDNTNYLSYSINNPTVGYNIVSFNRSAMTSMGVVDDESLSQAQLVVTGGNVVMDGLKINKATPSDRILVSRKVLTTPFVKQADISMEVEYRLDILA